MLSSVTMGRAAVVARLAAIQRSFAARGLSSDAAQSLALRMLDGQVRRQSMMLSFEKLFYLSGICFLCVLPLVYFLRAPKGAEKVEVHVEM